MTQIAQPQLHLSTLRSHRRLGLAALGALVVAMTAVTLLLAPGASQKQTSIPRADTSAPARDAGPAAGTPSAIARAFGSERVRSGESLTTNVPALPQVHAGPSRETLAAVNATLDRRKPRFTPPSSLTTNVPAPASADAG